MASRKSSRKQLQHIDREILKLVDQRAEVYKSLEQQGKLPPPETIFNTSVNFTAKRRLKNFKYNNLKHIFREINSECYNAARPLKITYLGPEGTFTNLAAVKHFGNAARFIAANSISAVFNTISNRKADFGVVPIENNTEGMVNYTLDMFQVTSVFIHSEFQLPINLYLLSKEKNSKAVKTIYSHPQPLAQCRSYLENNFHRIKLVETVSTSEAAAIASRRKNAAAIAALSACHQHKLNILAEQIEDASDNKTRFIVISGKLFTGKKKNCKTSLLFSLRDKPGTLTEILNILADNNINMKKIQSRPSKILACEYTFFIDLEGHIKEPQVKASLEQIEERTTFFKILGSYQTC